MIEVDKVCNFSIIAGVILMIFLALNKTIGQESNSINYIQSPSAHIWNRIDIGHNYSEAEFIDIVQDDMILSSDLSFKKKYSNNDNLGWSHYGYAQFYKGVEILGSKFILHEFDHKVSKANGYYERNVHLDNVPSITPSMAILLAKEYILMQSSDDVIRVNSNNFVSSKYDQNEINSSEPVLIIADQHYPLNSGNLHLCYKLILETKNPISKKMVLLDAQSGEIILSIDQIHTNSVEGIAHTKYHGIQNIIVDSIGPENYILLDKSRGNGIWTVNRNNSDTTNFYDQDNIWDNQNEHQDEIATDAHFAAEKTFDFYMDMFEYKSYDNNASIIVNKVHVGQNFNNAFWDGRSMNFGDGDGLNYGPFTSLDICAHEFTHGVTQETAGLEYRYESGALNESISDIFGKTIEHHVSPSDFSWELGHKIALNKQYTFRSMSSPNKRNHPQYYKGKYWEFSNYDAGGVHINSGVLNYWYFLLCEGGSGTNESNQEFEVAAIGFSKGINVVYRMLTVYLTPTSQYIDAYYASLNAAEDLYGFCSNEYQSIKQAWHAVGFDQSLIDNDLAIEFNNIQLDACSLNDIEVSIKLINNSCNTTFPSGSNIEVAFKYNGFIPLFDNITLQKPFRPGDTLNYSFFNKIKVRQKGIQKISSWLSHQNDPNSNNDTVQYTFLHLPEQNNDFGIIQENPSTNLICSDDSRIFLFNQMLYLGCDTLPQNTSIPYRVIIETDTLYRILETSVKTPPRSPISFTTKLNLNFIGFKNGKIIVDYPNDPTSANNTKKFILYNINQIKEGYKEEFLNNSMDSSFMLVSGNFGLKNQIQTRQNDDHLLVMTGKDVFDHDKNLIVRSHYRKDLFLKLNDDFVTKMSFCADLNDMDHPMLSFDLAQTSSNLDFESLGLDAEMSTIVAISVDGRFHGELITNPSRKGQFYHYDIDLSPFKNLHAINLQIECLALQAHIDSITGNILNTGDNNIIDNIRFYNKTTTQNPSYNTSATPEWSVYPNPTSNTWSITSTNENFKHASKIVIYNLQGKVVSSIKYESNLSRFGQKLNEGLYFMSIFNQGELIYSTKLLKQ